jgi:inactivated superfamily I helicase
VGWIDRDGAAAWVLSQLGAKRSAWNAADIRGQVEVMLARVGVVTEGGTRIELAEHLTAGVVDRCVPLLLRPDVPEHVRSLTSPAVLAVETEILERLMHRATPAEVP